MNSQSIINHCDIAIVGGGMVGASLALMLAKAIPKARVRLIESKPYEVLDASPLSSFDGRSTALAPTTVKTMQRLDVWSAMVPFATAIERIRVSDRGHMGKATFNRQDNDGEPLGYVVQNVGLGKALISAVQSCDNIQVMAPLNVTKLVPLAGKAECHLDDNSILQASLVLVADGADSPLRCSLGIAETVTDYQQVAMVANVSSERSHQGQAFERFTDQGPLALLPLEGKEGRRSAVVWTLPAKQAQEITGQSDEACLALLQDRFGDWLGKLEKLGARAVYPLTLRVAQEQVRSNVVLMGNAAHFLHPVAGQGFNLALRDALRLVEVLSTVALDRIGDLSVLQQYEKAQLRDQDKTIALSNIFNQVFKHRSSVVALLRNLGLLAVEHKPWVRNIFIRQLSGKAEPSANTFLNR